MYILVDVYRVAVYDMMIVSICIAEFSSVPFLWFTHLLNVERGVSCRFKIANMGFKRFDPFYGSAVP